MGTNIDIGSTVTTRLQLFYRDTELSLGTGFFDRWNEQLYLITNWHVVSGRHYQSKAVLNKNGAIPDRLKFWAGCRGHVGEWMCVDLPLYQDCNVNDPPEKPVWLEHSVHRHKVDVVAIPIALPKDAEVHTIDRVNTASRMLLRISTDVFVLGYPRGISGGGQFPVWKRASIATEPDIQHDGLPKMLIDTATREGMSGAPVIAVAHRGFEVDDNRFMPMSEHGYRLVGVYSGRLGDDEMKAQLGIVWKAQVVDEIIKVPSIGESSFFIQEP